MVIFTLNTLGQSTREVFTMERGVFVLSLFQCPFFAYHPYWCTTFTIVILQKYFKLNHISRSCTLQQVNTTMAPRMTCLHQNHRHATVNL